MDNEPIPSNDEVTDIPPRYPRRTTVALLATVAVALVVIALLGVGLGSAGACAGCHRAQYSALADSTHAGVVCTKCHFLDRGPVAARLYVMFRMVPSSFGGVELDGPGRPVGRNACVSCHDDLEDQGVVSADGLRINHRACAKTSRCGSCHGQVAHDDSIRFVRTPSMTECVACHVRENALLTCSTCHTDRLPVDRQRDPEWARVHGADWKKLHGTGDLRSCISCHQKDDCKSCHSIDFPHSANFGAAHGTVANEVGTAACLTCHKETDYCDSCHGTPMPHPADFLAKHSSLVSSVEAPECTPCHVQSDCEQCHAYHVHPGGLYPPVGRTGGGR